MFSLDFHAFYVVRVAGQLKAADRTRTESSCTGRGLVPPRLLLLKESHGRVNKKIEAFELLSMRGWVGVGGLV